MSGLLLCPGRATSETTLSPWVVEQWGTQESRQAAEREGGKERGTGRVGRGREGGREGVQGERGREGQEEREGEREGGKEGRGRERSTESSQQPVSIR